MLLYLFTLIQPSPEPSITLAEKYGLPGLLVLLMLGMFKYFIWDANKKNEKREQELIKENAMREKALTNLVESVRDNMKRQSEDWRETNLKLDRNYQDAINKFVQVIKEQAEQNNYSVQVLTELKEKIEELNKNKHLSANDFDTFKSEILTIIHRMGIEYNLSKKG